MSPALHTIPTRTAGERWRKVQRLIASIERIVHTNLILDTTVKPFRMPEEAAGAERTLADLADLVDAELGRLTAEQLQFELQQQQRQKGAATPAPVPPRIKVLRRLGEY